MTLTGIKQIVKNEEAYDILSALRGPDRRAPGASEAKQMTTAVIRHLLGLRAASYRVDVRSCEEAKALWGSWSPATKQEVRDFLMEEWHFRCHVRTAFHALHDMRSSQAQTYVKWLISEGIF